MGLLDTLRRKNSDGGEAERRAQLLRAGRIADGKIFDCVSDETGAVTQIFYSYEFGGVEYESSQTLDPDQRSRPFDYAPGASVTVRFDPRQPGNSIVV